MCEGEFESLKAIHAVSPGFVPEPYAWGKYAQEIPETYFLLAEFRDIGEQVRALVSAMFNILVLFRSELLEGERTIIEQIFHMNTFR